MLKKVGLFFATCYAWVGVAYGNAVAEGTLTHDAEKVAEEIGDLKNAAITVFEAVVPIILAVVGLGVLISFIKMIKKR